MNQRPASPPRPAVSAEGGRRSPVLETAYDHARALLIGPWATIPDDLHSEAEGHYMIDLVVTD
jgi:hypothetical protein